jgi:hypothetical protein
MGEFRTPALPITIDRLEITKVQFDLYMNHHLRIFLNKRRDCSMSLILRCPEIRSTPDIPYMVKISELSYMLFKTWETAYLKIARCNSTKL